MSTTWRPLWIETLSHCSVSRSALPCSQSGESQAGHQAMKCFFPTASMHKPRTQQFPSQACSQHPVTERIQLLKTAKR